MDPTCTFHLTGFESHKTKAALAKIIKKSTSEPFKIKLPDQLRPILHPGALVRFERQKDAMSFLSNFKKERGLQLVPCTQVFQWCIAEVSPWLYCLFDTLSRYAEQHNAKFFDTYTPSLLTGEGDIFPILEEQILSFINARYSTGQSDVQAEDVSLENVVWIRDIPISATEKQLLQLLHSHCRGLDNVYFRKHEAIAVFKSEEGARKLLEMKLGWFSISRRLKVQPCSRQIFTMSSATGAKWLATDYLRVCELARCAGVRESRDSRVITFMGDDNGLRTLEVLLKQEYIDDTEKAGSDLTSKLKGKERAGLTLDDRTGEMDSETDVDQTKKSHGSSSQTWEQLHGKQTQSTNKSVKDETTVESIRSSRSRVAPGDVRTVNDKDLELKVSPTTQSSEESESEEKRKLIANDLPDTTSKRRYNNQGVSVELEDKHSVDRESEDQMGQSTSATFSREVSKNFSDIETLMDMLSENTKPESDTPNRATDKSKRTETKRPDITALHKFQSPEENDLQAGKPSAHNGHDFPDVTLSKPSVEPTISVTEKVEFGTEEIPMDEDIVTFMFKVKRKEIEEIKKSNSVKMSQDVKPFRIKRRTGSTQFDGPSNASKDMKSLYKSIHDSVVTDKLNVGDLKVTIVSLRLILERVNEEQSFVYVKNNLNDYEIVVYGEEKRHIDPAMKKLKAYIRDEEEKYETSKESQRTNSMTEWLTSTRREPSSSIKHDPRTSERLSTSSRSSAYNRTGQATDDNPMRSGGKKSLRRAQSLDEELQLHLENRHYSFTTNEGLSVVVKHGDITQEVVDIIVNAANANLEHGGGVAKALVRAGGREIQRQSRAWVMKNGLLNFSEVALTGAGMLKAQGILHAYGPMWDYHGPASERLLCKTVENVLQYADAIKAKSIAIPAISSGVHGMPKDTCAKAMYDALIKFSSKIDRAGHLKEIVFVNIEPDTVRAFIVEFFSRNMAEAYGSLPNLRGQASHATSPSSHASVTPKADHRHRSQGTAQRLVTDFDITGNSSTTSQHTSTHHLSLRRPQVTNTSSLFSSVQLSNHGSYTPAGHYGVTSQGSPLHTTGAGGSTLQTGAMSNIDSISQDGGIGDCTICADDNVKLKKLLCCGFLICETCAGKHFASNSKCPSCQKAVVLVDGNQPRSSKMEYQVDSSPLPGYSSFGTIVIDYFFPDGIQEAEHPNPGKPYTGTMRRAYLPNNPEGRDVLDLLEKAFNKRLLFTIGTSHTTGQTDCVVWNDVHHKTSRTGGPTCYGYPDSGYLRRVRDELAAKGIK